MAPKDKPMQQTKVYNMAVAVLLAVVDSTNTDEFVLETVSFTVTYKT